ncbi:MAG: hypothetical protein ACFFB0_18735 [Promethearchaeota archaeon]
MIVVMFGSGFTAVALLAGEGYSMIIYEKHERIGAVTTTNIYK